MYDKQLWRFVRKQGKYKPHEFSEQAGLSWFQGGVVWIVSGILPVPLLLLTLYYLYQFGDVVFWAFGITMSVIYGIFVRPALMYLLIKLFR